MTEAEPKQTARQVEVQEFLQTQVVRRRLLPRAVVVGIVSGLIAVAFRIAIQLCEDARLAVIHRFTDSRWVAFAVPALIGVIGTLIAMTIGKLDPDVSGSGIPQMKAVLEGHLKINWLRVLWVKFLGAMFALGSGLAMGREGPTVQMGGAVGLGVAKLSGSSSRERRALSAAGSGAGLAAAFNAPLAGVTFVLEELQRDFQPIVFVAALLCAAVATVISRIASGAFPVFEVPRIAAPEVVSYPIFAIIGLLGGVLGVFFNRALIYAMNQADKVKKRSPLMMASLVGLGLGLSSLASPALVGGGHSLSEIAINGQVTLLVAIGFFLVRFAIVHLCYSTGVPGGIFAPLLSLGALIGLVSYQVSALIMPHGPQAVAACAVAGMCAMFSGVVRAPLTGVILIGEMTGSYDLLLPLLITSFAAYAVAEAMRDVPIYEVLLQRFSASRGLDIEEDEERRFVEIEIRMGSPLIGRKIRDAKLPSGILIVLCQKEGKEFVPNGNTELKEHMKVSVVATSRQALHELQELTHSAHSPI